MQIVATDIPDKAHASMFRPDLSVMSAKVITQRNKRTVFDLANVPDDNLRLSNTSMRMESKTRCVTGRQAPGTMIDALQQVLVLLSQLAGILIRVCSQIPYIN
eukprot:2005521-Ditylum_brightwellii.AAC.1